MEAFVGYKRKAVVVVPTHDNLRRRTSDSKRKSDGYLHDVPFGDLCDMKCKCLFNKYIKSKSLAHLV